MSIGANIRRYRKQASLTQEQLAKLVGVGRTSVTQWENDEQKPLMGNVQKLAAALGVLSSEIVAEDTEPSLPTNAIRAIPGGTPRPVIGRISAGDFGTVYEETGESLNVDDDVFVEHKHGFWMKVRGNSMNRLFAEGTMVYIDPNDEVRNGDVGVACVNGDEGTVKRIFFEPNGSVRLHPESYDPEYRDRIVDKSDPDSPSFQIEGKVVAYRSPLCWRA